MNGAFLKAKVPDHLELTVKMEGELAELMKELCPVFKVNAGGVIVFEMCKGIIRACGSSKVVLQ
jgi:hypothetical protein